MMPKCRLLMLRFAFLCFKKSLLIKTQLGFFILSRDQEVQFIEMAAPVFGFQGELLHQAAIYDQRDLLKSLLQAGVHGDANSTDPRGLTPLHTAALHDSEQCLKELLDWKGSLVYSVNDTVIL